jgi:hypothetical protein
VGSRIPVHQRLGSRVQDTITHLPRHRHFSPPNSDGWSKVLPRRSSRPARLWTTASRQDPAPRLYLPVRLDGRCLPAQLDGHCLNCLSYSHRRATCMRPMRCLRCFNLHHIARDCKRLRTSPTSSSTAGVVHLPRCELRRSDEASSTVMPRGSTVAGSTPRGDGTPWGSAAAGLTPSPQLSCSPPPPLRYASCCKGTHPCVGSRSDVARAGALLLGSTTKGN